MSVQFCLSILYFCEDQDITDVEYIIKNLQLQFPLIKFERANPLLKDWEQMLLMSECKHHIIANSSFSWWGAYIGFQNHKKQAQSIKNKENNNKIVCYPSLWFAQTATENTKDLYPCEWIQIEVEQ